MAHMELGFLLGLVLLSVETVSTQNGDLLKIEGENVILTCYIGETDADFLAAVDKWRREGSKVLKLKRGRLYSGEQELDFGERAELADTGSDYKDLYTALMKVTHGDRGNYKCFFSSGSLRQKRDISPPRTIKGDVLTANVGEDVTLNCSTSETIRDITEVTVEWRREHSYALVFRDGKPYNGEQDRRFEGRVEPADPGLRYGNLSMVLKNVTKMDNGIYQCFFIGKPSQSNRKKRAAVVKKLLVTHNLIVVDEPDSGGHKRV